ncbi:MAG: bifunctional diaminohydroxyphosphoribosylaminopyrimidine deaminase/5-amino-6-(5-phosphoribosylamino)uracil reductase RibD [Saprospiraceae bacterium]|nr:bifunctional diaminohydroxyphosphoribosylaminopyrimidine deaminase/5-amino-6-(5-phosphoribosylamino)uracil reductase RibD [Saprospiraceae bacterium]
MNFEHYIRRCFELAQNGAGAVSPNPLVGAVLVYNDEIIGEGYHEQYGEAHAEVNAFESVPDSKRALIPESTLFVNLEPCNHHGKTPPCSQRVIKEGVRRVVLSNVDPNPSTNGQGIEVLRKQGVDVITGILEKEGKWLNRRFFTQHTKHRPYIILKWAQSADGFIGRNDGTQMAISNALTNIYTHKWRSEEDAILIGAQTAINDDPNLTNRNWFGKHPIRILFDPNKRVPNDFNIFNKTVKTLVIHRNLFSLVKSNDNLAHANFIRLFFKYLSSLDDALIQSIIVEGGGKTLRSFIDSKCWDEARIITSTKLLNHGVKAPIIEGQHLSLIQLGTDKITTIISSS